jgi:hypothetical protein
MSLELFSIAIVFALSNASIEDADPSTATKILEK